MKTFNKIVATSASMNTTKFIAAVNSDIDHLNKLIHDYKIESFPANKRILVEIYRYHQYIMHQYPGNRIAQVLEFRDLVFNDMFQEIQKEFRVHGVSSLNVATVEEFDINASKENLNPEAQTQFEKLMRLQSDGINYFLGEAQSDYREEVLKWIKYIAGDEPDMMYSDLSHLKHYLRVVIAQKTIPIASRNLLRALVDVLNIQLDDLHVLTPEYTFHISVEANSFSDFIANMSPDKVAELVHLLYQKNTDLASVYQDGEEEAEEFKALLQTHSIVFLGGINSKNFKVTDTISGKDWVLKIENRLDAPKDIAVRLALRLNGVFTPIYADRQTLIEDENGFVTSGLVMTDFCNGGDLRSQRKMITDPDEIIRNALDIYAQMSDILELIRKADAALPDGKNSNWLINNQGILVIADTKSLVPAALGFIDFRQKSHVWYGLITTTHMNPPDITQDKIHVDALHAYALGKNLYKYLTDCSSKYLKNKHNGWQYDFSAPVFRTTTGKKIAQLIQQLVQEEPAARLSVAEAYEQLVALEQFHNSDAVKIHELKGECRELLNKIMAINPGLDRHNYEEKINNAHDVRALHAVVREFKNELCAAEIRLEQAKGSCKDIVDEMSAIDKGIIDKEYKKIDRFTNLAAITEYKIALKFRECRLFLNELEHAQGKPVKKSLRAKINRLDKDTDLETIDNLIDTLKVGLVTTWSKAKELKLECMALINEMDEYKIRVDDQLMRDYREQLDDKMYTLDLASLRQFKKELRNELALMAASPVKEIVATIKKYRQQDKDPFSIGKAKKADKIEAAFLMVPVPLRCRIFSDDPDATLVALRTALASHRYGGKGDFGFFKKGSTTEIDEKKAASLYKRLNRQFGEDPNEDFSDIPASSNP